MYSSYLSPWCNGSKEGSGELLGQDSVVKMSLPVCLLLLLPSHLIETDRTMTILCCGLLSKQERNSIHRVVFILINKNLHIMVFLLKEQGTSFWASYSFLTHVRNHTPWKNKILVTINSLQLAMLKILLCVLSLWCATANSGSPHFKTI